MNIELSEVLGREGIMKAWAYNVHNKQKLTEEEVAISETINKHVKSFWEVGDNQALTSISQIVRKIVDPEIFTTPDEILGSIFSSGSYEEFDKLRISKSPKNTLIARESSARTGNVDKSYINYEEGTTSETHLQIETQIKMSDLRRDGATTIADLTVFAIEEFRNKKFNYICNKVDSLITGSEQAITSATSLTKVALDALSGYLDDNCFEGTPEIVGLSSDIRKVYDVAGIVDYMSGGMKDQLNNIGGLQVYRGSYLVPIKAGKKRGDGSTLVPAKKLFGFAGKVGDMYTKGSMRTLLTPDNSSEKIDIKFTGVEFGFCINDISKVAKITIS